MSYASTGGMDDKFGANNIATWADRDNDSNPVEIASHKAAAIMFGDSELEGLLCDTHYRKPFVTASGGTPNLIVDIANSLAGCWLRDEWGQDKYDGNGEPNDSLAYHRTRAYKLIEQIKTGELRLDAI